MPSPSTVTRTLNSSDDVLHTIAEALQTQQSGNVEQRTVSNTGRHILTTPTTNTEELVRLVKQGNTHTHTHTCLKPATTTVEYQYNFLRLKAQGNRRKRTQPNAE